jgi:hypothetical protein
MFHDWLKDHHSIITRVTVSILLVLHVVLYTVDNVGYEKTYKADKCTDKSKWNAHFGPELHIMYSYPSIKIALFKETQLFMKAESEELQTQGPISFVQAFDAIFPLSEKHWDDMCDGYAKFNGLTYNMMILSILVLGLWIAHAGSKVRMITSGVLFIFAVITYAMRLGFTHHMMNSDSCQAHYFDKIINQKDGVSLGCEDTTHELQAESGILITSIVLSLGLGILQITTEYF